jgi:hypothetical protein
MVMQEALQAVVSAVAGHKAAMEAAGFSPTGAEQAAISYHAALMAHLARGGKA